MREKGEGGEVWINRNPQGDITDTSNSLFAHILDPNNYHSHLARL